jgi:hypothetical protein
MPGIGLWQWHIAIIDIMPGIGLWQWHIAIIDIMPGIYFRSVFYLKHIISKTELCLRLQAESTQFGQM